MDVSIAVSLIRGQMGTVVERAVNGAVETVLAEMLRVVGVKFEELKAELVVSKRSVAALQREKALKEKENDNIRARLRYTELKLKYYRQGVEEELQQRACAAPTLVHGHPPAPASTCPPPPHMSQQVPACTSSQSGTAGCPADVMSLAARAAAESVDGSSERDSGLRKDDVGWTLGPHPGPEGTDRVQVQTVEEGKPPSSSTLPPAAPQVKQEEEELICIKEEPEEEQEVMGSLLQPLHLPGPETHRSLSSWSNQTRPPAAFSSAGHAHYSQLPPPGEGPPARPAVRPWTKELSLYEEFKLRRNELRRRNLNRRRELEKTLPQPLLADMVRERREKTRLRVARWRAKRKLQACLNQVQVQVQVQAPGGAVSLSDGPISSQQLRGACASTLSSAAPPTHVFLNSMSNPVAAVLPFIPSSSSSSSSSSCFPLISQSQQGMTVTDADLLQ